MIFENTSILWTKTMFIRTIFVGQNLIFILFSFCKIFTTFWYPSRILIIRLPSHASLPFPSSITSSGQIVKKINQISNFQHGVRDNSWYFLRVSPKYIKAQNIFLLLGVSGLRNVRYYACCVEPYPGSCSHS